MTMTGDYAGTVLSKGRKAMKRPVHLVGHNSENFKGMVLSACNCSFGESKRFTSDISKVTCKPCLKLIEQGEELDPITRKYNPSHPSCVEVVKPMPKEGEL